MYGKKFNRMTLGKSYGPGEGPLIDRSSFKAKERANAEKRRIDRETRQREKKESDIAGRANNFCNYREMGYVPNRTQLELCGAENADLGRGSFNTKDTGGPIPDREVIDYLKRTRTPIRIVG